MAMPDAEAIEPKKQIERKKYLKIVNVLKKFVDTITITKRILNLRVNLTVDKLPTSAPTIEK